PLTLAHSASALIPLLLLPPCPTLFPYTTLFRSSGSTSQPKGVMLNHRTLLFQAALASGLWEIGADSTVVSWLPITHNFGLPLGVLTPLVTGATTVLLTPGLFIQHPGHWLELLDHYGGTHTGATNSALEYCVNSVASDSLPEISLSSVISVFCAGEPLREQTVGAFAEAYAERSEERRVGKEDSCSGSRG